MQKTDFIGVLGMPIRIDNGKKIAISIDQDQRVQKGDQAFVEYSKTQCIVGNIGRLITSEHTMFTNRIKFIFELENQRIADKAEFF